MEGLLNIIKFASESRGHLLVSCAIILIFGVALSIPVRVFNIGPFAIHKHVYTELGSYDNNNKEENKQ